MKSIINKKKNALALYLGIKPNEVRKVQGAVGVFSAEGRDYQVLDYGEFIGRAKTYDRFITVDAQRFNVRQIS